MAKRRKKKLPAKGRVCVSAAVMGKLISLGAAHHATVAKLKATARPVKAKKKAAKKASKKSAKKTRRRARK
jgi:ApbE superfamily uncharacterized protein (UPF0280 family)